jgi:hypothetical protein
MNGESGAVGRHEQEMMPLAKLPPALLHVGVSDSFFEKQFVINLCAIRDFRPSASTVVSA